MRIVLDSNVVFSALLWRGASYRLLQAIRAHPDARIIASDSLIEELTGILRRPHARQRLLIIGITDDQLIDDWLENTELVEPADITPRSPDPDDDAVLATALAGYADLIVSGDPDLLNLKHFHGIDIITVADALVRLGHTRGQ